MKLTLELNDMTYEQAMKALEEAYANEKKKEDAKYIGKLIGQYALDYHNSQEVYDVFIKSEVMDQALDNVLTAYFAGSKLESEVKKLIKELGI